MAPSPRWWVGASALGFAITVLTYLHAAAGLIPLPPRLDPTALRLAGWATLAFEVDAEQQAAGAAFVVADGYDLTSELAWRLPASLPVIGLGARWRLLDLPQARLDGRPGLLIEQSGPGARSPDHAIWSASQQVGVADRPGSGRSGFIIYRVTPRPDINAVLLGRAS